MLHGLREHAKLLLCAVRLSSDSVGGLCPARPAALPFLCLALGAQLSRRFVTLLPPQAAHLSLSKRCRALWLPAAVTGGCKDASDSVSRPWPVNEARRATLPFLHRWPLNTVEATMSQRRASVSLFAASLELPQSQDSHSRPAHALDVGLLKPPRGCTSAPGLECLAHRQPRWPPLEET